MTGPSDLELLARLKGGDESALAHLLREYWPPLVAYAARLLQSHDAAQDMVQEAFVRLWQRRDEWSLEGSVRGLLYRITRNAALDVRRAQLARHQLVPASDDDAAAPPPDVRLEGMELEMKAADAVSRLPARRREVFLLARQDGLSYQEIALVLHLSPQTVANHMSLALRDLRQALSPFLDRDLSSEAEGAQ
ncbi:MAG TPA: sigma-70 family RNA polymerase sigma factor [Gemmatimonadales bacterium]|nr:sigma-70 family RNA polymerase sigma factor [Gemmatimonadales bacterium]